MRLMETDRGMMKGQGADVLTASKLIARVGVDHAAGDVCLSLTLFSALTAIWNFMSMSIEWPTMRLEDTVLTVQR